MYKDGSLNLDPKGIIIRVDKSLDEILGYGTEELIGRDFEALSPPGVEPLFRALLTTAATPGASASQEVRLLRKDGSTVDRFLTAYPLVDSSKEVYSFIIVVSSRRDTGVPGILTDEFQRVFRFSSDAVAITDREGNIMDVNRAFLDTYGYRRDEVLGQNPRVLKSRHSSAGLYERMWKDILDPQKNFWRGEIINVRKDGSEVPVILSINAIKGPDGEIKNFLGIAFNISGKKELERTNRMYIDHIVHDLRGPLTTIMANSELLKLELHDAKDRTKRKLDAIYSSSQKLNSMTSDILDYSRAQTGSFRLKKEKVDFAAAFAEAAMPFENDGKRFLVNGAEYAAGVRVEATVEADPGRLQRIIYNLLSNAFKHASSEVRVTVEGSDEGLTLKVSDDGGGFSELDAERLFDAYYQTESGIKTGGAGLGLAIVKSFVEAHGGHVWADASSAKGATFGVFIPAR